MRLVLYWLALFVFTFAATGGLLTFAHDHPLPGSAAILIVFAGIAAMFTDKGLVE